jgi:hypothetical protein
MNLAFNNSFFSKVKKYSFAKIMVSSVYIPTMLNLSSVVVTNRHGS